MKLNYIKCGDYYLPDMGLNDDDRYVCGKYGMLRMQYLKEHRPGLFNRLVLSGQLMPHLREIDETCNSQMELLIKQMKLAEGVTEALKMSDQMEWVGRMNNIHARAEEIIFVELIYN